MVRTRAVPRNLTRTPARAEGAAAAAARLSRQTGGVRVKNIENNKHGNKDIKIKILLSKTKNIEVKQRGTVVRTMTVRSHAFLPAERRQ